jgi:hypothetical protein
VPWLTALAAWGTCGTWTRGAHFVDDPEMQELGSPDEGDLGDLVRRYGLAFTRATTFAVERRHGWTETASSPVRADHDVWDDVVMQKHRPGGDEALTAHGRFAAFREGPFPAEERVTDYRRADPTRDKPLGGVQWADWTTDGRLLVATVDGRLQIRPGGAGEATSVVHEVDLSGCSPIRSAHPPRRGAGSAQDVLTAGTSSGSATDGRSGRPLTPRSDRVAITWWISPSSCSKPSAAAAM